MKNIFTLAEDLSIQSEELIKSLKNLNLDYTNEMDIITENENKLILILLKNGILVQENQSSTDENQNLELFEEYDDYGFNWDYEDIDPDDWDMEEYAAYNIDNMMDK